MEELVKTLIKLRNDGNFEKVIEDLYDITETIPKDPYTGWDDRSAATSLIMDIDKVFDRIESYINKQ